MGSPALQQAVGASVGHGLKATVFFASAGYTPAAMTYAESIRACLFRFTFDGNIEPVNGPARIVFASRGREVIEREAKKRKVPRSAGKVASTELAFACGLVVSNLLQGVLGLPEAEARSLLAQCSIDPSLELAELTVQELDTLRSAVPLKGGGACWGERVPRALRRYRRELVHAETGTTV